MAWMLLLKSEVDDGFRRQLGGALAPPPSRSAMAPNDETAVVRWQAPTAKQEQINVR